MLEAAAERNWDEWVALGTLALASATVLLALTSWLGVRVANRSGADTRRLAALAEDEVGALREQIEVFREQIEVQRQEVEAARAVLSASLQPILVNVPLPRGTVESEPDESISDLRYGQRTVAPHDVVVEFSSSDDVEFYVSVPLRNVGPGMAVVDGADLLSTDGQTRWRGSVTATALASSERLRAQFRFPPYLRDGESPPDEGLTIRSDMVRYPLARCGIEVSYRDVAGGQRTRTRIDLSSISSRDGSLPVRWRVDRIHLLRDDDTTPFVSTAYISGA